MDEESQFGGVAEVYAESRRTYPPELREYLVEIAALQPSSAVLDIGAGTGQLATLVAEGAGSVVALDPEPDMVRVGQLATAELATVRWVIGSDRDVLELFDAPIDLVLIGNAFHHMDQANLLLDLDSLVSSRGAIVVCSTSTPVWLQDADWSRALRERLEHELGRPIGEGGTPDHESDVEVLRASPFSQVTTWVFDRDEQRTGTSIVGEIMSSAAGQIDPGAARRLLTSLQPYLTDGALTEHVKTTAVIATRGKET